MNLIKLVLISLGTISLCLGIIGLVVPGLPTTPFLLLTAGLYIRSSDKLYQKLITNKVVGYYMAEFNIKKGMTFKTKFLAITIMWVMILISCLLLIQNIPLKIIVMLTGVIGTLVMGIIIPTINKTDSIN